GQAEMGSGPSSSGDGSQSDLDLSHDTLARDLGRRLWDKNAKHVAVQGRWYLWDGRRWSVDECLSHMTQVRGFLRERSKEVVDRADQKAEVLSKKAADDIRQQARREARTMMSATTVAAVAGLARSNPASIARPDAFDADLLLLGTPEGTVDLNTGVLRPARRADMLSKLTAVPPAPPASP